MIVPGIQSASATTVKESSGEPLSCQPMIATSPAVRLTCACAGVAAKRPRPRREATTDAKRGIEITLNSLEKSRGRDGLGDAVGGPGARCKLASFHSGEGKRRVSPQPMKTRKPSWGPSRRILRWSARQACSLIPLLARVLGACRRHGAAPDGIDFTDGLPALGLPSGATDTELPAK